MAGTMSVPRSIQRIVMVPSGRGMLAVMKMRNGEISGMLLVSVYAMDFFRLSNIRRPLHHTQLVMTRLHHTLSLSDSSAYTHRQTVNHVTADITDQWINPSIINQLINQSIIQSINQSIKARASAFKRRRASN